jgi:hypothetical protein
MTTTLSRRCRPPIMKAASKWAVKFHRSAGTEIRSALPPEAMTLDHAFDPSKRSSTGDSLVPD